MLPATQTPGSLLKKPAMVFSTPQFEKCGFRITHILNGSQSSKMTVHPGTVRSLSKNGIFSTGC